MANANDTNNNTSNKFIQTTTDLTTVQAAPFAASQQPPIVANNTIISTVSANSNTNTNNSAISNNSAMITTISTTTVPSSNNNNANNSFNSHLARSQVLHNSKHQASSGLQNKQYQQQLQQQQKQNNHQQQTQIQTSRSKAEWQRIISTTPDFNYRSLGDDEILELLKLHLIPVYKLETLLKERSELRCVLIRLKFLEWRLDLMDKKDLYVHNRASAVRFPVGEDKFKYDLVNGACCENVFGFTRLPTGAAGPLKLDEEDIIVPLATTEGCLVASTNRGMSALYKGGGVTSQVTRDHMTRAPIVRFSDTGKKGFSKVAEAQVWLENNFEVMRTAFNKTSRHAKLIRYTWTSVHPDLHIRFEAHTGDAMGMNMCSKGVESALQAMKNAFPTMEVVSLSGNMCTDKKPSAINWINGRGKEVQCYANIPGEIVKSVLKVSVDSMIDIYQSKVLKGSALAGTIGGFNCQAANIVTAIFIATGQDPAQGITSSNCMMNLWKGSDGSLEVSCKMPSIECGTVGGGTILPDQTRNLQMMGIFGPTPDLTRQYRDNHNSYACKLARIICATVMAAELSLLAALSGNELVKSHMRHNRSSTNVTMSTQHEASTFS